MSPARSASTSALASSVPAQIEPTIGANDYDSRMDEETQPHEIAADPALRCRYPSKHCQRQRSTKKTGALHSLCAFHRAKANRNQRRLEKRRRVLKEEERLQRQHLQTASASTTHQPQQLMSMPTFVVMLPAIHASSGCSGVTPMRTMRYNSPRDVDTEQLFMDLEPFRSPVALFKEDLEELGALVGFSVSGTHVSYACYAYEEEFQSRIV